MSWCAIYRELECQPRKLGFHICVLSQTTDMYYEITHTFDLGGGSLAPSLPDFPDP